jgi:alcohol dehydrogenase
MQAHRYPALWAMVAAGRLDPARLVGRRIALADAPTELMAMNEFRGAGITVIDRF